MADNERLARELQLLQELGIPVPEAQPPSGGQYLADNERLARELQLLNELGIEVPPKPGSSAAVEGPQTTASGIGGAIVRGLAPQIAGASLGALAGAPFAGIGAIPGAAAGLSAVTLAQLIGDPLISFVNNQFGTNFTTSTDALGHLFTQLGVPEPRTEVERVVEAAASGAGLGGGFAATGRALENLGTSLGKPLAQRIGASLAQQPALQVASGGTAGIAAKTAEELGASPEVQLGAAFAGGMAPIGISSGIGRASRFVAPRPTQPTPPPAQAISPDISAAEEAGVRLLTSDVRPPQTFVGRTLQATGERIPIAGTGGIREAQQAERINSVRNLLTDFGADDVASLSDDVLKDFTTQRASELSRYQSDKREIISRLTPRGVVNTPKSDRAITSKIEELRRTSPEKLKPVISELEILRNDLKGKNIEDIERVRRLAGEAFDAPELASVRTIGKEAISSIYGPIRDDIRNFVREEGNPGDLQKWIRANSGISERIDDVRRASLKTILQKGEVTPEVVQNVLFRGKPSDIRELYKRLSPEGKAAARSAVLAKAAKDATIDVAEGQIVSPDKFVNQLKKMGDSVGIVFNGADLQRVRGLTRVLNITKRAAEFSAAPPTGVQAVPFLAGSVLGQIFGGPVGAATGAASIGFIARLYESAPVRNLLLRISKTKPGSTAEKNLSSRLFDVIKKKAEQSPEEFIPSTAVGAQQIERNNK